MITPNDPPNSRIPHSKSKPVTPHRSPISPTINIRTNNISLQLSPPTDTWFIRQHINHISMMMRHCTRKHLPRTSHTHRPKRLTIWNNLIYSLRSRLLHRLFLSLLPFKPRLNPRTRGLLATYRYSPPLVREPGD